MRTLNYHEDIHPEYSVPKGAKKTISPALIFSPPTKAVLTEKHLEVEGKHVVIKNLIGASATLANPTDKAIPVVLWLQAFQLKLKENAEIKRKPPDPNGPPIQPPVPPPPFQITIPPRTTVKFTDWVYLDEYDYAGSPEVTVEWSMGYADGPKPTGELSIKIPPASHEGVEANKDSTSGRQDTQALLKKWESIPDLLPIAREKAKGGDAYALLGKLEAEYRKGKKLFRITTVYRHRDQCSTKEHQSAATEITLVNPRGESVGTTGMALHEVEIHRAAFPLEVAAFLRNLPE